MTLVDTLSKELDYAPDPVLKGGKKADKVRKGKEEEIDMAKKQKKKQGEKKKDKKKKK